MTKFVAIGKSIKTGANEKYVKQTFDMLSDTSSNLELIAIQIAQLPVREQHKFFRLLLNYIEIVADRKPHLHIPMQDMIMLCERLIKEAMSYYEEKEQWEQELITR